MFVNDVKKRNSSKIYRINENQYLLTLTFCVCQTEKKISNILQPFHSSLFSSDVGSIDSIRNEMFQHHDDANQNVGLHERFAVLFESDVETFDDCHI